MYYICYKDEADMEYFGFEVELLYKMHGMSQHGSNSRAYPCYFYKKRVNPGRSRKRNAREMNAIKSRFEDIEQIIQSSSLETKLEILNLEQTMMLTNEQRTRARLME